MGIRLSWKEDLGATTAEMEYGQPLRLPGQFLSPQTSSELSYSAAPFVAQLKAAFEDLRPSSVERHGDKKVFVFKDLATASHVFIRNDDIKRPMEQLYSGPYRVMCRSDKWVTVRMSGRNKTVSVDRLKPAFVLADDVDERADVLSDREDRLLVSFSGSSPVNRGNVPSAVNEDVTNRTRYGRRVRFPDRFQARLSRASSLAGG
jgi:hypothetical protein